MVVGEFLWRRLAPLQRRFLPAWLYIGHRDATRMHIGEDHNLRQEELATMLKVVVGVNNVTTSILPREDLALCNDRGRVALQETLPKCNARGIQERTLGMAPRSVQILGDEAGPAKSSGAPSALGAGETEGATAAPLDANLPQCEEAPVPEDVTPYHQGEVV
ncbi:hypothetical protein E2562_010142 [Oryza meyeriana var. granulata]|uniref:Uncharacterized protein n=1 Tax=Oryza meyeriana var. granulata TaxID=110450 RepID=A0A6G1EHE2_9ORYZ|nr:hypothetical protein E2562_010142 [Oryza meyeriana var. granulata]